MDIKEYNGTSLAYMGDDVAAGSGNAAGTGLAEIQNFTEEE